MERNSKIYLEKLIWLKKKIILPSRTTCSVLFEILHDKYVRDEGYERCMNESFM